jgi:hypothetical protein
LTPSRAGRHIGGTMKKKHTNGRIHIVSEKEIPYVELKVDMDNETIEMLAQAGWIEIQHDKDALVNYAFSKALEEYVGHARQAR